MKFFKGEGRLQSKTAKEKREKKQPTQERTVCNLLSHHLYHSNGIQLQHATCRTILKRIWHLATESPLE